MNTYVSLLRGVNVSGQKKIKMADLKKLYESLDFQNVETYIQSGNVIFKSSSSNTTAINKKIETAIEKKYNFHVPTLLLTPDQLSSAIKNNPFPTNDPKHLHVIFLFTSPPPSEITQATESINLLKSPTEQFTITKNQIYLHCPDGIGRSKLSTNTFEKKLKVSATTRNWRTTNTLLEKCQN